MNIDYEFACQDDCLDKMVLSDLRKLICERDQAYRNIDAVKAERNALAAQLEALQSRISAAERVETIFSEAPELIFEECKKLFPEEIRELRAEAGRAGYIAGAIEWTFSQTELAFQIERAAELYADNIKEGE